VQIKSRRDRSLFIELRQPSVNTTTSELELWTLLGVYEAKSGERYVVESDSTGSGLAVELPTFERLWFPKRNQWTFIGDDGRLEFQRRQEEVIGFILEPSQIVTIRR